MQKRPLATSQTALFVSQAGSLYKLQRLKVLTSFTLSPALNCGAKELNKFRGSRSRYGQKVTFKPSERLKFNPTPGSRNQNWKLNSIPSTIVPFPLFIGG